MMIVIITIIVVVVIIIIIIVVVIIIIMILPRAVSKRYWRLPRGSPSAGPPRPPDRGRPFGSASGYSAEGGAVDGGCSGWRAQVEQQAGHSHLHKQCWSDSVNSK